MVAESLIACVATRYLWDGNSEYCKYCICSHQVTDHNETLSRNPFVAKGYGNGGGCRCREFQPYRHLSEVVTT